MYRTTFLEHGGLGGVQIAGENPIWMITPAIDTIPISDSTGSFTALAHHGDYLRDGQTITIDWGRTSQTFELEEVTASAPQGGNGWADANVPVYFSKAERRT